MSKFIIYHNPRCSKSRETLALLEEKQVEIEVIEYLKTPPSEQELKDFVDLLGIDILHDLVRTKEPLYKELDLSELMTDDELAPILVEYPKLIERPIVLQGNKAVIGRPPENVLELING
ncbi:arsenate reductase (glutaredoxin) [Catenovulum maritimum]|uniref:Arsenate reductase n=1 Tax=Catenovulum maritimum TaxID=1513271 RepID=A0A0J8JPI1_9ALTE|nr:arsenate reductase (glutaredoxin) [Catenovulum maritimum]KMT66551.1 arsenate reductase [Catenovulum maritimum]